MSNGSPEDQEGSLNGLTGSSNAPPPQSLNYSFSYGSGSSSGTKKEGIFGRAENLLRFSAASLVIVAGMGLPAVYLQFDRFDVPTHYITYNLILSAGIIPSALLILTFFYIYYMNSAINFSEGYKHKYIVLAPLVVFLPIIILPVIFYIAGLISFGVIIYWSLAWLVQEAFSAIGITVSKVSSLAIFVAAFFAFYLLDAVVFKGKIFRALTQVQSRRATRSAPVKTTTAVTAPQPVQPQAPAKPAESEDVESYKILFKGYEFFEISMIVLAVSFMAVYFAGSAKVASYIVLHEDMDFYNIYEQINKIGWIDLVIYSFIIGLCISFVYIILIFTNEWVSSKVELCRRVGLVVVCFILMMSYIGTIVFYASDVYPNLPPALGGGKPKHVTIWLEEKLLPADLVQNHLDGACDKQEKFIRCKSLLLHENASDYILVNEVSGAKKGFSIARKNVVLVSW